MGKGKATNYRRSWASQKAFSPARIQYLADRYLSPECAADIRAQLAGVAAGATAWTRAEARNLPPQLAGAQPATTQSKPARRIECYEVLDAGCRVRVIRGCTYNLYTVRNASPSARRIGRLLGVLQ